MKAQETKSNEQSEMGAGAYMIFYLKGLDPEFDLLKKQRNNPGEKDDTKNQPY